MTTNGPSARARYMLGMVVDATGSGMYLPLSLLYFHHVTGLPLTRVGTLMTAAAVIGLISNPAAGVLIDRFGARAVVTGGYLLRAAGFCTYPLVDNGASMFAVLLVVALGDMSYPPAIQSFIAEFVRGADRDKLLAVQRSLRNAGLGVGGLLAGAVLALGSTALYHVIVFGAAAGYVAAALCIGSLPVHRAAPAGPRVSRKGGYRLVARNRPFLALTLLNMPTAFGYTVLSVGIPVYVTRDLGASHSLVGVLYAVNTVGIALLQIPVTRGLVAFRRTRTVAFGAAVFAVSFVVFALLASVGDRTVVLAGVFVATLLFTGGELMHGATASALCAQAAPEETRGRHLAVYQLSWAVPIALAPAALTALLTLSPTAMWLVLAVGATVSCLGVLRLERRLPREAVHPCPGVAEAEPGGGPAERAPA
ncbi:MFS transporter [Streptomyces sp. TP-A0875]|uniref:MFS transporter n=1 Tax=Streptomyces sp. TP-A0875 TaxID=552354 RepID=UPI001F254302|nr:MFS transporter [Streptomyces sp. TP-A0875]